MLAKVRMWYQGKYVPYRNDPDSILVFMNGNYHRHWTAVVANTVADFWLREWKWIIGTTIAVTGLVVAFLKLG